MLLKEDVDLVALSAIAEKIQRSEQRCSQAYDRLIEQFPNSIKVLRSYGRFVEFVKNDSDSAQKHYEKATQLTEAEARVRQRQQLATSRMARRRCALAYTPLMLLPNCFRLLFS
jgi:hypothetical protein